MRKLTLLLMLVALAGCKNTCRRPIFGENGIFRGGREKTSAPRLDPPASARPVDPLLIPPPEGGLPTPSSDPGFAPAPAPRSSPPDLPPPVVPETSKKPATPNGKELVLPDPLPGFEAPAKPTTSEKKPATTTTVNVPGFAIVREGIATGRKPNLDGYDSLRSAGYKTVVYLHTANADVSAMKSVAEKRGLAFIDVVVDADTIKPAAAKLIDVASDSSAKPIYICDDDGARTGCLWYAYFRALDGMSDDAAQVKAAPLGLRDAGPDKAKLLAAVQEFLAKK